MSYRSFRSTDRRTALGWSVFAAGLVFGSGCSDDDSIPEPVYEIPDGGGSSSGETDTRESSEASQPTDESSGALTSSTTSTSDRPATSDTTPTSAPAPTTETPDSSETIDTSAPTAGNSSTSGAPSLSSDTSGGLGGNSSEDTSSGSTGSSGSTTTSSTEGNDTVSTADTMSDDSSLLTDAGPDASEESTGLTGDTAVDTSTETGVVLPPVTTDSTSTGGGGLPTIIGDVSDAGDAGIDGGMDAGSDDAAAMDSGLDETMDTSAQSSTLASTSEMNSTSADACMCSNGIQDGDETGIDCGGCCGGCPGSACVGPEDCASGLCPNDVCITPAGEAPPAPMGTLGNFVRYEVEGNFVDLPVTLESSASVEFGNKVFILGGNIDGSTSDAIYEATIGNDGFFQSFALDPSRQLVTARMAHRAEIIGGYIYVFGGVDALSQTLTSVERAPLGASGIAGPFETVAGVNLATARHYFATVTTPGYVYAIGGNYPELDTIERASVSPNGDITSTFTALTRIDLGGSAQDGLNVGRWTLGVARIGPDVYFVGGEGLSSIERSTIQNDGSLGVFTFANPLPSSRNRVSLAILADTIYAFGGWSGSFLSTVESAPIVAGEIGTWSTTSITLENPVENGTPLRTNAAVYLFGGFDGSATNYIQRAIIQQ